MRSIPKSRNPVVPYLPPLPPLPGDAASDSYPTIKRTDFALKVFKGPLKMPDDRDNRKARTAVCYIIQNNRQLRISMRMAGYRDQPPYEPYNEPQHRMLWEFCRAHPEKVREAWRVFREKVW